MPGTGPMTVSYETQKGPFANVQGQQVLGGPAGVSVQPLGGNTNVDLMRGLSGIVTSNEAVRQEISGVAKEIATMNDRTFKLLGTAAGTPGFAAQQAAGVSRADMTAAIRDGVLQAMGGSSGAREPEMRRFPGGGGAPPPTMEGGGSSVPMGPPRHAPSPTPEGRAERSNWDQFQDSKGYDMGRLRQDVAGKVQQKLSETTWGTDPGAGGSARQVASYARRQQILGAAKGVAGQVAGGGGIGQGLMNALPAGLGKFAGAAGAAWAVGNKAASFAEEQRAENNKWQSIMGGSNAAGFGERFKSRMFAANLRGTMGGADAENLYMGVAQTGLKGRDRGRAEDFAVDSYKRFGMSVDESVKLVQTAADNGVKSFKSLTSALDGVTKSAKSAGFNTEQARQQFSANLQSNIPLQGYQAAVPMAKAQTNAAMTYGREIGGSLDQSGQNSQQQILMSARAAGMSPNQYVALAGDSSPGAVSKFAGIQDQKSGGMAQQLLGKAGTQMVFEAIRAKGGDPNSLEESDWAKLTRDYLNGPGGAQAAILPQQIEQMMAVGGLTPHTAITFLMKRVAGVGSLKQQVDKDQAEHGEFQTTGRGSTKGTGGQDVNRYLAKGDHSGLGVANTVAGKATRFLGAGSPGGRSAEEIKAGHASDIYRDEVKRTGRGGGVSEALASSEGFAGDRRIKVKTKGGKERVVTTDDALRHFRDQIDQGDAEIVSGTGEGKTVAEETGLSGNKDLSLTSDKRDSSHGKTLSEFNKDKKGGGGKVVVQASPELQKWLRFMGTGNVSTDPTAGNSPPNSRTTPSGYTTDSSSG